LADDESTLPTPHPKLRIALARQVDKQWLINLLRWLSENPAMSDAQTKQELAEWVPEYSHPGSIRAEGWAPQEFIEDIENIDSAYTQTS
jgi:hypothetical protein